MNCRMLIAGLTANLGGMEVYIMNNFRKIIESGIKCDFLIFGESFKFAETVKKEKCELFYVPPIHKNPLTFHKNIENFFRNNANKYDIVWSQQLHLINIDVVKFARKYGVKRIIVHAHGINTTLFSHPIHYFLTPLHMYNSLNLKNIATDYWACSHSSGKFFYCLPDIKFEVMNNGVDRGRFYEDANRRKIFRDQLNINGRTIVIGFIGRLDKTKNPMHLIFLAQHLRKNDIDFKLMLVGDGELRNKIEKSIKDKGLEHYFIILGNRNDVSDLLQVMDVLVLPSFHEALGLVAVEAQACNVPVVTSTNVSSEICITEKCSQISLNADISIWCEEILKLSKKRNVKTEFPQQFDLEWTSGIVVNKLLSTLE